MRALKMAGSDHIRSTDSKNAKVGSREQSGFEEVCQNTLQRNDGDWNREDARSINGLNLWQST